MEEQTADCTATRYREQRQHFKIEICTNTAKESIFVRYINFMKNSLRISPVQLPLELPLLLETIGNFLERFLILIPGV